MRTTLPDPRELRKRPSPGRQVSGMAGQWARYGLVGRGAASRRPPRGLPRDDPGAELYEVRRDASRAAPGPPRGRATPGRRDAARAPSWSGHGPVGERCKLVGRPPVSD